MGSLPKDTHKYAFAMVEAARIMPADRAEKLDHIKQLRFNVQLKNLRKKSIEESHRTELLYEYFVSFDK